METWTIQVLIEHPSSVATLDLAEALRTAGYEVANCLGPGRVAALRCPLLANGSCPLVEKADVIVNGLSQDQQAVHEAQRETVPATPMVLLAGEESGGASGERVATALRGSDMLSGEELVELVAQALARARTEAT